MESKLKYKNPTKYLNYFAFGVITIWTLFILLSIFYNLKLIQTETQELLKKESETAIDKDILYRRWNSINGGVYVAINDKTQPNPYLDIPEREIQTPSGKKLTLINHTQMTKMLFEISQSKDTLISHLSSLKPIISEYAPDKWEELALNKIEGGLNEFISIDTLYGKQHLRYMKPFKAEEPCLYCHAKQGYNEGDIIGGLTISFPTSKYAELERSKSNSIWLWYSLIWLFTSSLIYSGSRIIKNNLTDLKESEKRLKLQFERMPFGYIVWGDKLEIVSWNPASERIFGYSSKEALGKKANDLIISKETEVNPGNDWNRIIESELSTNITYENLTKDGRKIICEWANTPLKNYLGKTIGVMSMVQDITERKQSEKLTEALYELSKAVYSTLDLKELFYRIHNILSGIIRANNFFIALLSSDGTTLSFPYGRDEKDPDDWEDIRVDDLGSLTGEVVRTKRSLLLNEKELRTRYSDGENRSWGTTPKCWLGVPLINNDKVIGVMAVQDYNQSEVYRQKEVMLFESTAGQIVIAIERKLAEERLKNSENKYRSLFDKMLNGFALHEIICDEENRPVDYRFLEVNSEFESITGLKAIDIIGKTIRQIAPETEPFWIETYGKVALTGKPTNFENFSKVFNKYFLVSAFSPGKHQFATIIVDITEHKKAESESVRLQNLESLTTLISGITHDFRNLITVIKGQVSILEVKSQGENTKKNISGIMEATKSASVLMDQLLSFAGSKIPRKTKILARQIIEETAKSTLKDSSYNTEFIFEDSFEVEIDREQMTQAIKNIIINAMEAMPNGGKLLVKTSDFQENEKQFIIITIQDTGIGIAIENIDKIFNPYFSTKIRANEKGSGLGLSVSYSIIKNHNGKLLIESQVGVGTNAKIYLPAIPKYNNYS